MATVTPRPNRRTSFRATSSDIFSRYERIRTPSRRARAFIETECLVPGGRGSGKPYRLRPVHRRWLREAFDGDVLTLIVSGPRGMGKTGWMAAVGVWALFDRPDAQVLFCSTSMRTAMQGYSRAVRIIETSGRMTEQALVYRNKADPWVELPVRGSTMRPLPADEKYIVGQAPTLILIDEVGYVDAPTLETMQTSLGKVERSALVAFGTPGLGVVDSDATPNQMYRYRQLSASEEAPPDLRYVEHAARSTDDPALVSTWRRANPLVGDLVSTRAVAHDYATMPAARFGQMRLGLWTDHEAAWMPRDAWEALDVDTRPLDPGALVSLGFDGSVSRDSTGLVARESATGRFVVLGHWKGAIPRAEVMATVDRAFADYNVSVMYADPWWWRQELQELAERYGEDRVVEWNTASIARMGPASDAFLAAVLRGEVTHDGSDALTAHVLSAVAKRTAAGDVIARDARRPQDTDLAVAAILAYEAGRTWTEVPMPVIW